MATTFQVEIPTERLGAFCRRWQIAELALFGSALRPDFHADSDIDLLVTFAAGAKHSIFDMMQMRDELQDLFGRHVDLAERRLVEASDNYIRRRQILTTAQVIHGS